MSWSHRGCPKIAGRRLPVRSTIANKEGLFKPEMFANVTTRLSRTRVILRRRVRCP
jgi:hypothetical protein